MFKVFPLRQLYLIQINLQLAKTLLKVEYKQQKFISLFISTK